jgi:hypothetical protein
VAVTAIKARCRRCRQDFHLFEVLDQRDGTCPRCGWSLSHHWTATLLEEAARADIAQRHLVAALRRLRNLPILTRDRWLKTRRRPPRMRDDHDNPDLRPASRW